MISKDPLELIVTAVHELSLAKDLSSLMFVVTKAARKLTSADGVTFVLRDKDQCFYADEDAIAPLWKGHRFPVVNCISGWSMLHKRAAVIADVFGDDRIPHEIYKTTFVKSLAMMPIRSIDPIGAIGCYWNKSYTATEEELKYLKALADITSVSFEKLQLYTYLKEKMGDHIVGSHQTADILFSPQRFMSRLAQI